MKEKIKQTLGAIRRIAALSLLVVFCSVLILFWGSFLLSGESFDKFLEELDEEIIFPIEGCIEGCWFVG
ncbi:hypothetical protein KKF19_03515 [Patescibacteria group bacterium]|nr:hypothetical protein [Patescibacteria group bacterium]